MIVIVLKEKLKVAGVTKSRRLGRWRSTHVWGGVIELPGDPPILPLKEWCAVIDGGTVDLVVLVTVVATDSLAELRGGLSNQGDRSGAGGGG